MVAAMKKVGIAFVVILVLLTLGGIGTVGVKAFMRGYQKGKAVPADLATRAWPDQVKLGNVVTMDVPFPLQVQEVPIDAETRALIAETTHYTKQQGLIVVLAGFASYKEEMEMDLNAAADGAISEMGTRPGFKISGSKKSDTKILGNPAVETLAEGSLQGAPIEFRGLYFTSYGRFFQTGFLAPKDSEPATAAWRRMKESIRVDKPEGKVAPAEPGGLPAGMRPRGAGKP